MITAKEKSRINEVRKDWTKKFNEMRIGFGILEKAYHNLPWHYRIFWGKAKMHGLVKKNEAIFAMADKEWEIHEFNFFEERNKEFQRNHEIFIKIYERKNKIKVKKNGIEYHLSDLGKEAFKH